MPVIPIERIEVLVQEQARIAAARWDHVAAKSACELGPDGFEDHTLADEQLQQAIEEFRQRKLAPIEAQLRKLSADRAGPRRLRRRLRGLVEAGRNDRITIARMEQHVLDVAALGRVRIHWRDRYRYGARALSECLEIWTPRIRSANSYATALHELGHCLGRYQTSRSVIVVERWAWRWAKENALVWTDPMERCMTRCVAWYEARAPWPPRIVNGPPGCQVEGAGAEHNKSRPCRRYLRVPEGRA
jgi:hypothetical protein